MIICKIIFKIIFKNIDIFKIRPQTNQKDFENLFFFFFKILTLSFTQHLKKILNV
jgi:hypothetical protein